MCLCRQFAIASPRAPCQGWRMQSPTPHRSSTKHEHPLIIAEIEQRFMKISISTNSGSSVDTAVFAPYPPDTAICTFPSWVFPWTPLGQTQQEEWRKSPVLGTTAQTRSVRVAAWVCSKFVKGEGNRSRTTFTFIFFW